MDTNARLTRRAPLLAALASLAYCFQAAIVLRAPQAEKAWGLADYAVEAAFVLALAASLPLLGLLGRGHGRASTTGVWLARLGFGAMLVSAVATLGAGANTLGPAFVLGLLAALGGLGVLAVIGVRHRTGAWWVAPVVAAGFLLGLSLADNGGGIVLGVAWALAGLAFRRGAGGLLAPRTQAA